ncbi:MAG: hypothetical protein HY896_14230 [Deltaproteobacteria bacterium]|nr:hypothetical protein [Deltaproteobacteria bacterium]
MGELLDFLTSAKLMDLATDPRVLFLAAVVFIAAVLLRSKFVLLLLFAVGGVLAVIRYSNLDSGAAVMDKQMLTVVGGILAVAVVLIYFLFIRGD